MTDRNDVWAIGGRAIGALTIDEDGGTPTTTDMDMTMGAIGARGQALREADGEALDLAVETDTL